MTNTEIQNRCLNCVDILKPRALLVAQEHRERIKQLINLEQSIRHSRAAGQLSLDDDNATLSPDLLKLLGDPTHNL
mgnify:FL=1